MLQTILDLILINVFVSLVHEAGFFTYLDEWVSGKWKFAHLPYIMLCALCQTFWLSLIYVIATGQFSLLTLALCVLNGHMTKVMIPLYRLVENILLKVIELLNKLLGY